MGCTVVELLTTQPPYYNLPAMTAMFRIVSDSHPPLPKSLSQVLLRLLARHFNIFSLTYTLTRPYNTHTLTHSLTHSLTQHLTQQHNCNSTEIFLRECMCMSLANAVVTLFQVRIVTVSCFHELSCCRKCEHS